MAYNIQLAERIRSELDGIPVVEWKMFGGIGYMLNGKLTCGRPLDMAARPRKGWVVVEANGVKTGKQLNTWIKEGVEFALTLPPK